MGDVIPFPSTQSLVEEFPVVFAQFGETIVDICTYEGFLLVLTESGKAWAINDCGEKTEVTVSYEG